MKIKSQYCFFHDSVLDQVDELEHQDLVAKKQLNILKNQKEGVELKLERSAQTVKNEAFKVSRMRRRNRRKRQ